MSAQSIGHIRSFKPWLVRGMAGRLELDRHRIGQALTELLAGRRHIVPWSGPAAMAAFTCQVQMMQELARIANRLGVTAQILTRLAERMDVCLELVRHADQRAAEGSGWLNREGQLFLPQPPAFVDPVLASHHARREAVLREEVQRDLRQAERVAMETDRETALRLRSAARALDPQFSPAATRLPIPLPPQVRTGDYLDPASAFASAAWWRGLTREEQGRVVRDYPQWIGPRDGVPAWARHRANLALLGRAEADAAGALAVAKVVESRQTGHPGRVVARAVVQAEERRVEALQAVRDAISRKDGVPRQLLALDESGDLTTAVVAIGDVDSAEHVATFVGGFTTTVHGNLRSLNAQLAGMRAEAVSLAHGDADVAVVAWLGYPAPQWNEVLGSRSVLSGQVARDHSDELAVFLTGLDAARDTPLHSTLWAHSYGSTLAGNALQKTSAVDDVALFGSPGVPFQKLEDVGLKPGSLNVLQTPDDWIPKLGPAYLGTPPLEICGVRHLATVHVKGMPNDLNTAHGHSEYREHGTLPRRSLVALAAGRPDLVIPASTGDRRPKSRIHGPNPPVTQADLSPGRSC